MRHSRAAPQRSIRGFPRRDAASTCQGCETVPHNLQDGTRSPSRMIGSRGLSTATPLLEDLTLISHFSMPAAQAPVACGAHPRRVRNEGVPMRRGRLRTGRSQRASWRHQLKAGHLKRRWRLSRRARAKATRDHLTVTRESVAPATSSLTRGGHPTGSAATQ